MAAAVGSSEPVIQAAIVANAQNQVNMVKAEVDLQVAQMQQVDVHCQANHPAVQLEAAVIVQQKQMALDVARVNADASANIVNSLYTVQPSDAARQRFAALHQAAAVMASNDSLEPQNSLRRSPRPHVGGSRNGTYVNEQRDQQQLTAKRRKPIFATDGVVAATGSKGGSDDLLPGMSTATTDDVGGNGALRPGMPAATTDLAGNGDDNSLKIITSNAVMVAAAAAAATAVAKSSTVQTRTSYSSDEDHDEGSSDEESTRKSRRSGGGDDSNKQYPRPCPNPGCDKVFASSAG